MTVGVLFAAVQRIWSLAARLLNCNRMMVMSVGVRVPAACALALLVTACSDSEQRLARHLERGRSHMSQGKVAEAVIEYRNAIKADPRSGEARFELAKALEGSGDPQAAREYLRAAELLPNRPDVQLRAGALLLEWSRFEEARKHADTALAADPSLVDAQILRAFALAGLKDMEGAITELERASEGAPGDFRPYASLGAVEALSGDRAEAEAAFKKAVEADPASVQPKLALAYFYWSTHETSEAERLIQQVLAGDSANVPANRLLALLYGTTRRLDEAEKPLLRLVQMNDSRAALALADLYLSTQQPELARPLYESVKSQKALGEVAVARLAGLDFRAGRRAEAYAALDARLKETPNSIRLMAVKAQMLIDDGRRVDALQIARRAVAADPRSPQAHYVLGAAEAQNRNGDAAAAAYRDALRLHPGMVAAQIELSRLLLLAGEREQALHHAQAAQKAVPAEPRARVNLVRALLHNGDVRQAETDARRLVEQLPDSPTVLALYGHVLLAKSDTAGAVEAFDRALALNPAEIDAVAGRMTIDLARNRPEDARARLARAAAAAPSSSAVLLTAARFERAEGNATAAEQHLRKALELEPDDIAAYQLLAGLYVSQHRLDEGKRELLELVRRKPDAIGPRTMIAIIDETQGRKDDAVKLYEAILQDASTAAVAANNLAYLYVERGDRLDRALELAQQAKAQLPGHPDVSDTLGWIYYKQGMLPLAIKSLEFSVGKDPKNPLYLVHLGLAYAKAGESNKARAALSQALRLDADVDGAAEARAVLASFRS